MTTQLETKPSSTSNSNGPEFHHITCCDANTALCGQDVSAIPVTDGKGEQPCVVCYDLKPDDIPCRPDCRF